MKTSIAKFILAMSIIASIVVITLHGGADAGAEDGVLGMALMGLTTYKSDKEK